MSTILDKLRQYGVVRTLQFALSEVVQQCYYQKFLGSYSQNQEDLRLDKLLTCKKRGLYVDVGAYDPYRFSNTMRFYKRGWNGINIEPNIENWKKFQIVRGRDINLNIGVAERRGTMEFFSMDPPTLSTFSGGQAEQYERQGFRIKSKKKIKILPLREIFAKHVGKRGIDFLSMDVEGFEMSVLKGNDWKRFRPHFLCIETALASQDEISRYLQGVGYKKVFDNGLNSFYVDIHE